MGLGGDNAYARRATTGVPQGTYAGAVQPEPGVPAEDRPGLAVTQFQLHPPAGDDGERVPPFRRVHRDSLATAQRERPHGTYSVPSAGSRSGSPSRGNWSLWKVMISAIFPPLTRRTSIVNGRYAPSL